MNNLYSEKTKLNFIGVRLGDVTWDWNNTVARNPLQKPLTFFYDDIYTTKNKNVTVNIKAQNFKAIRTFQFT